MANHEHSRAVGSPAEIDGLRHAFLGGLARAAGGLSDMIGDEIRVVEPRIELVSMAEATALVGPPEQPAVGIYLGITGEVAAHVVLLFAPSDACGLVDLLIGNEPGTTTEIDEMGESALGEVGNVMGSFFANVLGDLTGFSLWSTPPAVQTDMAGALVDGLVASASGGADQVLLVKTRFEQVGTHAASSIGGTFLVMPDVNSLATLLAALGEGQS